MQKYLKNLSPSSSSSSGIFFSGNSYKKSSTCFWVSVFSNSLGPFIIAWEPNKLFPIPFFQIVWGALLPLTLKSSVGGGIKTFDVLNKFPLIDGGGGGGAWGDLGPPSKKSSIEGKEGGSPPGPKLILLLLLLLLLS